MGHSVPPVEPELLPGDVGWSPGPFTELRVHGVGNTPLVELLDNADARRVAGDETAGFYRSRDNTTPLVLGGEADGVSDPELNRTDVEAYDWGGFNTGGGWRAFWLLLLPFTFVNVAGFLVARRDRWARSYVRLFGLGVGLVFVTWLGAMAVELLALQCGWQEACYQRQLFFKPLGWDFISEDPARRMALVLLVPLAIIGVLWRWPGRRTHDKYERVSADVFASRQAAPPDPREDYDDLPLLDPTLWTRTRQEVPSAALVHVAALLGALGAGVSWAHWKVKDHDVDLVLVVAGAALLVVASVLVFVDWTRRAGAATASGDRSLPFSLWLARIAVVFFVVLLGAAFVVDRGYASLDWGDLETTPIDHESGELLTDEWTTQVEAFTRKAGLVSNEVADLADNMRDAFIGLSAVISIPAFFGLVFMLWKLREDDPRSRRMWGRWGPLVASLTGLAVASVFVAGAGLWLEEWLGDRPNEHFDALGIEVSECALPLGSDCSGVGDLGAVSNGLDALVQADLGTDDLAVVVFLGTQISSDLEVLGQPVIELDALYDALALAFLLVVVLLLLAYMAIERQLRHDIPGGKHARRWITASGDQQDLRITYPFIPELKRTIADLIGPQAQSRSNGEIDKWAKQGVTTCRKSPRLTRVHHLLWIPAVVVFFVGSGLLIKYSVDWSGDLQGWVNDNASYLFTSARWLITAAALGAAALVSRSYKPEAQESFGGAWDVLTFWPRHYHPFAVPSYGVRAVKQLANRIETLTEPSSDGLQAPRTCLVAAHSGGVVIAIAAVALLREETRSRIALLTYGSPTGSLYGRAYPEYYDQKVLQRLAGLLGVGDPEVDDPLTAGRWANLWRLTDWTGGYAFGPQEDKFRRLVTNGQHIYHHVDVLQRDPAISTLEAVNRDAELPAATGHTDYFHDPKHPGPEDPRYQEWRGTMYRRIDRSI